MNTRFTEKKETSGHMAAPVLSTKTTACRCTLHLPSINLNLGWWNPRSYSRQSPRERVWKGRV